MTTNNSVNLGVQENADGGEIKLGIVGRILKWLGADVTITGAGSATITFPTVDATLLSDAPGEIDVLDEKATPVAGDWVLIEDSEDDFAKKKVDADNFGGGGGMGVDGWVAVTWANPTRTSATVFTVDEDITAVLGKGDKLKFTDTTTKYLPVYSVTYDGGTTKSTITTIANDDYALVGNPSAISYSKIENPQGWPEWFDWTPTLAVSGGTVPTYTSVFSNRFCVKGKTVTGWLYWYNITGGTAGNGTGVLTFTLPATAASAIQYVAMGTGTTYETSGTIGLVNVGMNSTTEGIFILGTTSTIKGNDQSSTERQIKGVFNYEI